MAQGVSSSPANVISLPSCRGQNCGVQASNEMEDHAMSLIRNGYAVSTRRGILGVLFSALLALDLFDPGAATAHEVKQIKLTDKHSHSATAAYNAIPKRYEGGTP